jgi:hypothetical protein
VSCIKIGRQFLLKAEAAGCVADKKQRVVRRAWTIKAARRGVNKWQDGVQEIPGMHESKRRVHSRCTVLRRKASSSSCRSGFMSMVQGQQINLCMQR